MGHRLSKDIKDEGDGKYLRDLIRYEKVTKYPDLRDPFGPIKYDVYEAILESYAQVLPQVAQRIEAIEEHLEKGVAEGRSFVRSAERPDVGGEAFEGLNETMKLMGERLDRIENALSERASSE